MALPDVVFNCVRELGVWRLVLGGCTYEADIDALDFTCHCAGVLTLTTPGCCAGAPATITVTKGGTWVSCGDAEPVCGAGAFTVTSVAPTPKPTRRPLPVCANLGAEERVAGSTRLWRRCGGGHGSPGDTPLGPAIAGLVVQCGACRNGEWRLGSECGPKCPGYTAGAA